jgi:hypothetical protein
VDDDLQDGASPPRFSRLLSDPLTLRHRARLALAVATAVSGIAWAVLDGTGRSVLLALGWFALPVIAVSLGAGDGFFIEHGRGGRRALLTIVVGAITSLASCGLLSSISDADSDPLRSAIAGAIYAVMYAAITLTLGATLGIAFGKGSGYLGRRIQQVDDEGW